MAAIRKKSKVLLDFLYEDSVEMDMAVFSNAISVGQKWIWDYLVERGCPFGPETYSTAVISNNIDAMDYLDNLNCRKSLDCLITAIKYSDVKTISILCSRIREYRLIWSRSSLDPVLKRRNEKEVDYIIKDFFID